MLVDRFEIFAGPLFLGNPLGSIYRDHQQTGDITFASGPDATPLGSATIKIIANGDDINVPAAWLLVGGDEISTTPADENHLFFLCKDADVVYYTNKVVTP